MKTQLATLFILTISMVFSNVTQDELLTKDLKDQVTFELVAVKVSNHRGQNLMAKFRVLDESSDKVETIEWRFPAHSHTVHETSLMVALKSSVDWTDKDPYVWHPALREASLLVPKDENARGMDYSQWVLASLGPSRARVRMDTKNGHKEIHELHKFFQEWFTGSIDRKEENLSRFSSVLAREFVIITPSGKTIARDPLIALIDSSYGSRDSKMRISITNARVEPLGADLLLATYGERQEDLGVQKERISTAILRRNDNAPNGFEWVRVHETWIEESGK